MASLKTLERDGLTGFDPEWNGYTGRAYQWRVKAQHRVWFVGLWFDQRQACENLPRTAGTAEWRKAITRNLREGDETISVDLTYKDYQDGKPLGRISVLRGTRYPVSERVVRGGKEKLVVMWANGTPYESTERTSAPTKTELLNAEIGTEVGWYIFAWSDDGWKHMASITSAEHKDAFVSILKRQGKEVYVAKRPR